LGAFCIAMIARIVAGVRVELPANQTDGPAAPESNPASANIRDYFLVTAACALCLLPLRAMSWEAWIPLVAGVAVWQAIVLALALHSNGWVVAPSIPVFLATNWAASCSISHLAERMRWGDPWAIFEGLCIQFGLAFFTLVSALLLRGAGCTWTWGSNGDSTRTGLEARSTSP
jgi:hypothetical protein